MAYAFSILLLRQLP